ncbi:MAG: hypothetical protein KBS99_07385 [Prevotellaceae bacterium]|nr:hypothetical protein [Candidatus Colivivens caballi]
MAKIKADNFYINTDKCRNVWITEEMKNEKTGKMYEKRVSGYFSSFDKALINMFERNIFKSETTTLEGMISEIEKAKNEAVKILEARHD